LEILMLDVGLSAEDFCQVPVFVLSKSHTTQASPAVCPALQLRPPTWVLSLPNYRDKMNR
jgi:hypothetical protein